MWSPFSFDGLDVDDTQLPNITTDMGFDEGIVKADDKADDDGDLDLFRSYQLTKEGANCDDDPSCKEDSMPDPDEDDDFEESAFAEMENIMAEADEDDNFDDEINECGDNLDDDFEESAFAEMENIFNEADEDNEIDECDDLDKSEKLEEGSYADIAEAVLEDEEDDLIDIAMDADSDEDVNYGDED